MQPLAEIQPLGAADDPPRASWVSEVLFPLPATRRTTLGILTWWESRRLMFNAIVGVTGFATLTVLSLASLVGPRTPIGGALIPVAIYAVMANVCFTLGSVIEISCERVWKNQVLPVGPVLFRQGLAFAVGLTLLPIPLAIVSTIVRLGMSIFGWR